MMSTGIQLALFVIRTVSPALVLLVALSLIFAKPATPGSPSPITSVVVRSVVPRRAAILALLSIGALTFLGDGLTFVIYAVMNKTWPQYTGIEVNAVLGVLAFSGLAIVGAWKDVLGVDVWSRKRVKAVVALALALDIALVIINGLCIKTQRENERSRPHIPEYKFGTSIPGLLHLVFPALRVLVLLPLLNVLLIPRVVYTPISVDDEVPEPTSSSFLLPPSTGLSPLAGHNDQLKYGTFRSNISTASGSNSRSHTPTPSTAPKPEDKSEITLDPSWSEIGRRVSRLAPYLWPSKSRALQGLAVLCILLVIVGRGVNLLLPLTFGKIVSIFDEGTGESPWPYLFFYVALRFLQGAGGLAALRDSLWAPVMQYSDREMSQLSFDHLLNLSFSFHTHRKTGEILRVLDRGAAINHTLELILFNIIPTFADIAIALVAFVIIFDWTLACVIFVVMFSFVAASVILTRWRTKIRRQMNEKDIVTRGIHTDCLLNYETVKYFGGEQHEGARYAEALREYQALEYQVIISLNLLNLVQNAIITAGLLIGSLIVAARVVRGESSPSDFVMFITYIAQLYGPLNSLGYIYRSINQSLIDTEKLLKLLNEPTEINDKPNAPDLIVKDGTIEFENVNFSYDNRSTALQGVSFKVPRGASVALVGESGAGKSTILRLLYRFYDLAEGEGRILIDGQDIRDVTQASLRKAIGVVPQDSVLFNSSISYNIGYGKFGASPEEIEEAAKSAQMHDRIQSFPDGYQTLVGERGVRLSGGEKQRVAIARTLLKNPPILLLDEATSALDTSTEKDIQKALQNLVKGRSSLSIAHRLSTIASADIILVIKDGQVIEQGNHRELVALGGVFATMWADQISTSGPDDNSETERNEATPTEKDDASTSSEGVAEKHTSREAENAGSSAPTFAQVAAETESEEATSALVPTNGDAPKFAEVAVPTEGTVKGKESVHSFSKGKESVKDASPTREKPSAKKVAAPIAFPSSDDDEPTYFTQPIASSPPLAFPTSGDDDSASASVSVSPAPVPVSSPGVKFGDEVAGDRDGTPDPENEPKRKRISSQNFQRLARRISLTTRRQGSTGSSVFAGLGLGKDKDARRDSNDGRRDSVNLNDDTSARGSVDIRGPTSGVTSPLSDSPAGSLLNAEDKKSKKIKKDKKGRKVTL